MVADFRGTGEGYVGPGQTVFSWQRPPAMLNWNFLYFLKIRGWKAQVALWSQKSALFVQMSLARCSLFTGCGALKLPPIEASSRRVLFIATRQQLGKEAKFSPHLYCRSHGDFFFLPLCSLIVTPDAGCRILATILYPTRPINAYSHLGFVLVLPSAYQLEGAKALIKKL